MIDIKTLGPNHIGKWVEYAARGGDKRERGRIKGWNSRHVFVVYSCDDQWWRYQDFTGAATSPRDLQFIENENPDTYPPVDSKIISSDSLPPIVDRATFLALVENYNTGLENETVKTTPELDPKVDLIARVIPPEQVPDYWAGFYTGILAMTGAMEGFIGPDGKFLKEQDARVYGNFIAIAAVLAYTKQREAEYDEFDRMGYEDFTGL